jgi:catechol 2,3-dioxygenase-like lactoylglutathione lyase family enzyme
VRTVGGMAPTLNAVGLVVADMAKSLAFYRRLGLDLPDTADAEPHVEAALPGGIRLLFDTVDTVRSFDPGWTPAVGGPPVGLAFQCADPAEVDRVYADLVAAGYEGHKEPWDAFWGQRYALVRDPDGNGVDLFAALPTA